MTETTARPTANNTIDFSHANVKIPSSPSLSGSYPSPWPSSGLHQDQDFLLDEEGKSPKLVQQSLAAAILCKRIMLSTSCTKNVIATARLRSSTPIRWSQFTAEEFLPAVKVRGCRLSMNCRGYPFLSAQAAVRYPPCL